MSAYSALIQWSADSDSFMDNTYSRAHSWRFDGGTVIAASSSPSIVPEPCSVAGNVDPEEAFVASLSSCHMLWFLSIARDAGLVVERYDDNAKGTMAKNDHGAMAITEVVLNPEVKFSGMTQPDKLTLETLHHRAHDKCFIANSVHSKIIIRPKVLEAK